VQRNKSFLVVCVSILITTVALAQDSQSIRLATRRSSLSGAGTAAFEVSALPIKLMLTPPMQMLTSPTLMWISPMPVSDWWTDRAPGLLADRLPAVPLSFTTAFANSHSAPASLTDDYYSRHFGFFCKRELELEKTIHVPLRFRLGSLEYCNRLEGK
jgi:hypothetical protein